jgi:hypothetical protein
MFIIEVVILLMYNIETFTKEFISKITYCVIPACRESFFKKDAGFIR